MENSPLGQGGFGLPPEKEQQLDLFADRLNTQTLRANQLRLYFSSFAYVLLCAVRRLGLRETEMARAQSQWRTIGSDHNNPLI